MACTTLPSLMLKMAMSVATTATSAATAEFSRESRASVARSTFSWIVSPISVTSRRRPFAPEDRLQDRHRDQHEAERADHGRARRQVELDREVDAERRDHGSHGPADRQPVADPPRVEHRGDGRHDQVAEDEEHPRDRDGRGYHEAERGVEEEVPEAHVEARHLGLPVVERDGEELAPEDVMEGADQRVEARGLPDLGP